MDPTEDSARASELHEKLAKELGLDVLALPGEHDGLAAEYGVETACKIRPMLIEATKRESDTTEVLGRSIDQSRVVEGELRRTDAELLTTIEKLVAMTKEKDEWKNVAFIDPLTGIPNRRGFMEMLGLETSLVDRVMEGNINLYFLMVDADHFKMINDIYGHDAGDYVLKELAKVISARSRKADFIARPAEDAEKSKNGAVWGENDRAVRLGGEEFGILAWCRDDNGARIFAEGLRKTVENHSFVFKGQQIVVTVSIGAAKFSKRTDSMRLKPEEVIKLADIKVYEAKQKGRNRVEV